MNPQVIVVHDVNKAIEDVGVQPYANTLVQEMAGDYFYVEAELIDSIVGVDYPYCVKEKKTAKGNCDCAEYGCTSDSCFKTDYWKYRVWPVPLQLAYFIIDSLTLKSAAMHMGTSEPHRPGLQAVYLTPGTEIFGKKIEKLTEIPAELGPVVVEKL